MGTKQDRAAAEQATMERTLASIERDGRAIVRACHRADRRIAEDLANLPADPFADMSRMFDSWDGFLPDLPPMVPVPATRTRR